MAAESRDWLPNPFLLIAILLVAGGVLVKTVPLESTRPTDAERKPAVQLGRQDVLARLWQDPFAAIGARAAVRGTPAEREKSRREDQAHAPKSLAEQVAAELRAGHELTVLAVMVFGGTYPEDTENRRRTRYAVVSGLGASKYAPDNADAIGYVWTDAKFESVDLRRRLPETLPYEWFVRTSGDAAPNGGHRNGDGPRDKVLVLWLEDEAFDPAVMAKLERLVAELACAAAPSPCRVGTAENPLRVIGPAGSGTLKTLVQELHASPLGTAKGGCSRSPPGRLHARFYSPFATLPDARLLNGYSRAGDGALVPKCWEDRVEILRAIGGDDALVDALVEELELRNVNRGGGQPMEPCRDTVAIVSEWDTEYARGLNDLMKEALARRCGGAIEVRWFSYLRGLDGALPETGKSENGERKPAGGKGEKSAADDPFASTLARERVEGRSQYDYLRRIGDRIGELDRIQHRAGGSGVRAVGVLGSDVYDKLLVLQALHPRFPDAIFFTTDLDARLAHPDQSKWARNLVVASNYGLALNPGLQREVPAFRDAYQTAAFLATRIAALPVAAQPTRATLGCWLAGTRPTSGEGCEGTAPGFRGKRIFEIGRTRPVEVDANGAERACETLDAGCANVHPLREWNFPTLADARHRYPLFAILALVGAGMLALLTSRRVQGGVESWWASRHWLRTLVLVAAVSAGAVWFWCTLVASIKAGRGEPFLWLEGVSIWPTAIFYLAAIVLSIWFLRHGWVRLHQTLDRLEKEFRLPPATADAELRQTRAELIATWLVGPLRPFRTGESASEEISPYNGRHKVDVAKLWRKYRERHTAAAMAPWILLTTGALTVFVYALAAFDPPFFPHRGELARTANWLLVNVSLPLFILLVVAVVYVTRTCTAFIVRLAESHTDWPQASVERYMAHTGLPKDHVDDWIDFKLVVKLTDVVNGFIYCPFIVLLLLVVVRSDLFDALDFPLPTMVVALVLLAYAAYCAIILRRAAEAARRLTLRNFENRLLVLKGDPAVLQRELGDRAAALGSTAAPDYDARAVADQLRHVIDRIRATQEGAFLPLGQQPFMRALLIPFGGYGGISLVDWLAFARL